MRISKRKKRDRNKLKRRWSNEKVKELRKQPTPSERKFRTILLDAGYYRHVFQKYFLVNKKIYIADFFLPRHRTIIEIDGGYHKGVIQKYKDKIRERNLFTVKGVDKIIRIKNEDVETMTPFELDQIIKSAEPGKTLRL